jgi:2-dehydro-3-deoxygalactonokinase
VEAAPVNAPALIAVDWGTTAARAYGVDADGRIVGERRAELGIVQVPDGAFAAALATLLGDWAALPVPRIACGMIGSRQGWVEAPYRDCPAALASLASGLVATPGGELLVVPGVICVDASGVPDVMRGEETQILGCGDVGEASQLAILPGTHSKWARVSAGRIEGFATWMTGELYAILMQHSILGRLAGAGAAPGALDERAFARGVARGLDEPGLTHAIFGARTLALTGGLDPGEVGDWLSGLLIGHEIASARARYCAGRDTGLPVRIIGSDALAARYLTALALAGIDAIPGPADAAARGLYDIACTARLIG